MMRAALLIAALLAAPAAAQSPGGDKLMLNATGTIEEAVSAFRTICVASPLDPAAQRRAALAQTPPMERQSGIVPETWAMWPVQLTIQDADGYRQCHVVGAVRNTTTMEEAARLVRPLAAKLGARREGTGPNGHVFEGASPERLVQISLTPQPGGQTAVLSVLTRKAG